MSEIFTVHFFFHSFISLWFGFSKFLRIHCRNERRRKDSVESSFPPIILSHIRLAPSSILSSQPKCVYNCVLFFFSIRIIERKKTTEKVWSFMHRMKSFKLKETKYVLMLSFWESSNDPQFTHIKPKNKINLKYS